MSFDFILLLSRVPSRNCILKSLAAAKQLNWNLLIIECGSTKFLTAEDPYKNTNGYVIKTQLSLMYHIMQYKITFLIEEKMRKLRLWQERELKVVYSFQQFEGFRSRRERWETLNQTIKDR